MSTSAASQSIATNQTNFDVRKEDKSVAGLDVTGDLCTAIRPKRLDLLPRDSQI